MRTMENSGQVGPQDREELDSLQQRVGGVLCLFEYARLEAQQAELRFR